MAHHNPYITPQSIREDLDLMPTPPRRPPRQVELTIEIHAGKSRATLADASDVAGELIELIDKGELQNRAGDHITTTVIDFEVRG